MEKAPQCVGWEGRCGSDDTRPIPWHSDVTFESTELFLYLFCCAALLDTFCPLGVLESPSVREQEKRECLSVLWGH